MFCRYLTLLLFLVLAGLAACLPLTTPPTPLQTVTPQPPTDTPTPTIMWFPPTATDTPLPAVTLSITPTLDLSPQFGALIFADDFSDPDLWMLGKSQTGSIAMGINELTLAISQERGYLFSLRQKPTLSDFYLEITASPSICRGDDEYGLLLRASPNLDFYRFSLLCNGQARVDRYYQGNASSPQPPTPNGAIPPGAPSISRLAVLAQGEEMRFFANDVYLFSVRDTILLSGGLGLFVRAAGEDMITVNFSELAVYEVIE